MKNFLLRKIIILLALLISSFNLSAAELSAYPFTGTLYPVQVTKISSQVQGRMLLSFVDVCDYVKKDQIIASLDPIFYESDFQKAKILAEMAKVACEEAQVEFNRMQKLWEKQEGQSPSISKKQFEEAYNRLRQKNLYYEQSLVDLDRTKKILEETKIKAPYDGVITHKYIDSGEAITVVPVTPIFEIMDVSSLYLEFSLPQDLLPVLKIGQEVVLEKNLRASIDKIYPHIDVLSRCFKCRATIKNPSGALKPGAFVKGYI